MLSNGVSEWQGSSSCCRQQSHFVAFHFLLFYRSTAAVSKASNILCMNAVAFICVRPRRRRRSKEKAKKKNTTESVETKWNKPKSWHAHGELMIDSLGLSFFLLLLNERRMNAERTRATVRSIKYSNLSDYYPYEWDVGERYLNTLRLSPNCFGRWQAEMRKAEHNPFDFRIILVWVPSYSGAPWDIPCVCRGRSRTENRRTPKAGKNCKRKVKRREISS